MQAARSDAKIVAPPAMLVASSHACNAEERIQPVCWHAGIMVDGPKDMKPLVEAFAKQVHST